MTKKVLVSVSGRQFDLEDNEPIELITTGEYYLKNGKHYILYDEQLAPEDGITKNTIKIGDGFVELKKRGSSECTMIFEVGKKTHTKYQTPIGPLFMGVHTKDLSFMEKEEEIEIGIAFHLEVEGEHVSRCEIKIKVGSSE